MQKKPVKKSEWVNRRTRSFFETITARYPCSVEVRERVLEMICERFGVGLKRN